MDSDYLLGSDVLVAPLVDCAERGERFARGEPIVGDMGTGGAPSVPMSKDFVALVRIKDLAGEVKKKGAAAELFYKGIPDSIARMAYDTLKKQLEDGAAKVGSALDVRVLDVAPPGAPPTNDLLVGASLGAVGVGAVYGLFRIFKHFIGGRR